VLLDAALAFAFGALCGALLSRILRRNAAPLADAVLRRLDQFEERIMATLADLGTALDTLTTEVGETTTAEESVVVLLGGIKTQLDAALAALAAAGDPQVLIDRVTALSAQLDARQAALAEAVTANTPAP
jgi:hypothetical protein